MSKAADLYSTKIEKYIYDLIEKKALKAGDRLAPEREIAQKFNISNTPVRQATRKLVDNGILERIPGKGIFVRSEKAPEATTNRIAVIHCYSNINVFASPFFKAIMEGIDAEAKYMRKRLLFCTMQGYGDGKPEDTLYDLIPVVDGFILMGILTPVFDRISTSLRDLCKPVVVVNDGNIPDYLDSVVFDNKGNTREMTSFLLDLGHRKIAHVSGRNTFPRGAQYNREERIEVFREVMHERGCAVRNDFIIDDFEPGETECLERLMRLPDAPTAVFCFNDIIALQVMDAAKSLGIRVPEDLTVVGYDGIPEAGTSAPGLTTVETPLKEMGRMGMERLIYKIREKKRGRSNPMRIVLSSRLVARGSHGENR